jgi:hypothetical protein
VTRVVSLHPRSPPKPRPRGEAACAAAACMPGQMMPPSFAATASPLGSCSYIWSMRCWKAICGGGGGAAGPARQGGWRGGWPWPPRWCWYTRRRAAACSAPPPPRPPTPSSKPHLCLWPLELEGGGQQVVLHGKRLGHHRNGRHLQSSARSARQAACVLAKQQSPGATRLAQQSTSKRGKGRGGAASGS